MSTDISRTGRVRSDTHAPPARPRSRRRGQRAIDTQASRAATTSHGEGADGDLTPKRRVPLATDSKAGHGLPDTQEMRARQPDLAVVLGDIREHYRLRCDYHSAEKRLTLQIKSVARRHGAPKGTEGKTTYKSWFEMACEKYGHFELNVRPLEESRVALEKVRLFQEKTVERLAKELPVWAWVERVAGVGALMLGQIIAECGDLGLYASPAKVWKRMGVGLFERLAGEWSRQRKLKGDEGKRAGYSPRRAAVVFNLGDGLIRAGAREVKKAESEKVELYSLYLTRKIQESLKPACNAVLKTGGICKSKDGDYCKPGHMHNRARRYIAKRFLRDLWREWIRVAGQVKSDIQSSDARHPEDLT